VFRSCLREQAPQQRSHVKGSVKKTFHLKCVMSQEVTHSRSNTEVLYIQRTSVTCNCNNTVATMTFLVKQFITPETFDANPSAVVAGQGCSLLWRRRREKKTNPAM